ncbi:MAG: response regulator transcription factor [Verrucomicrobiota bacterium]
MPDDIRIWLIEDNDPFRGAVARAINRLDGMRCDRDFGSFEDSQMAMKGTAPDVLLLDVGLPGLNGIEALAEIQKLAPDTRVVILTVFDDADKIFQAICAGASGYLLKTSGMDEIADAIRQVMEGGAPMTPKVAKMVIDLFGKMGGRRSAPTEDYDLTPREKDILELMVAGLIKKEIADRLDISVHTVSTHLRSVYEKLHVNTNTGAVAKAIREGII